MPAPFSRVTSAVTRRTRKRVQLAILVAATFGAVSLLAAQAQTASNHNATRADFDQLMKELSNWGRWGKDDQMGAVNLITPAKRQEAAPRRQGRCLGVDGAYGGNRTGPRQSEAYRTRHEPTTWR